jgi:uncharacterized protein (TIGR03382 family)
MRSLGLVAVVATAGSASAAPMRVSGTVTSAVARWTADGSRIVTESVVHTAAGDVAVSQLGGTVDGLTMRTFPGLYILQPGMDVDVSAHGDVDLSMQPHIVVDDVVVKYAPYFVRTGPTKAGHDLYWESGCIFVTVDSDGTKEIAGDDEFPIVDASIQTWNTDCASCSYMQVKNQGKSAQPMEVGNDGINLIKFRDSSWCRPAVDDDPARCYPDAAAGITSAVYIDDGSNSRDGAIVDADIEINGVDFAISVNGTTLGTQSCDAELQNTLTHEVGHLHGLAHTCQTPNDPANTDNLGNPVPLCGGTLPTTITEATMYPFQDCGETKKETLETDDISGICDTYPTAMDPGTCSPVKPPGGGCCSASGDGSGALVLGGLVAGVLGRRRRRR